MAFRLSGRADCQCMQLVEGLRDVLPGITMRLHITQLREALVPAFLRSVASRDRAPVEAARGDELRASTTPEAGTRTTSTPHLCCAYYAYAAGGLRRASGHIQRTHTAGGTAWLAYARYVLYEADNTLSGLRGLGPGLLRWQGMVVGGVGGAGGYGMYVVGVWLGC